MIESKITEIRTFMAANANPEVVKKYERYFKEGYDGYGVDDKLLRKQIDEWIAQWKAVMTLDCYLDLADELMKTGRIDEKSLAIILLNSRRDEFSANTFERMGNWFPNGINNWANADILCMLISLPLLEDEVISFGDLKTWNDAESEWQRRCVPVTLVEYDKHQKNLQPADAFLLVEPLMLDGSEYVQKGIGTLLRGLWKKYPSKVEAFLLQWKDQCGRLIVQYATEKMDKEYRKQFRKSK